MKQTICKAAVLAGALVLAPFAFGAAKPAHACAAEPMLAGVCLFAGNFAPRGWAYTDGQLLLISSNTALFALLGVTYGGDGRTTFALPDLRGRVPVGPRTGSGLSTYTLGQRGGVERVTLSVSQMPAHNHAPKLRAQSGRGNEDDPTGAVLAMNPRERGYSDAMPDVDMSLSAIASNNAGASQPHENRPPFLAINFIIATQGIFPSRD